MNAPLSIYLDLVRFLAAVIVFITHAQYERFTSGWLNPLGAYGNDAVMVFFVLSGYVIASVAKHKENTASEYMLSRFARLWSVVVPAVFITLLLDYVGSRIDYSVYAGPQFRPDDPLFRIFSNLFFVQELWFTSVRPFSNGPFWSIGYEFWYYVAFAALMYVKSHWKWFGLAVCALFAGPKIMILFPIWLFGVLAYEWSQNKKPSERLGWLFLLAPIALYILYRNFELNSYLLQRTFEFLGEDFTNKELSFSREFLGNYVVGILIAIHFYGFSIVSNRFSDALSTVGKPIRFLAGYTFSLYLFHYPLLQFSAAIIHNDPNNIWHQAFVLTAPLIAIYFLGNHTEKKKHVVKRILRDAMSGGSRLFHARRKKTAVYQTPE